MLPKTKIRRIVIKNFPPSTSESVIDSIPLPQDLIIEILLYLPVKSLVKFKLVSKPWRSLISSPEFIKSHLATCSKAGQYSNHQLLCTNARAPNFGIKHCSLSAALHNPSTNISDIEYPSRNPEAFIQIVGIVNGLVCLAIGKNDLYLWNPNLRKSKHLPCSNFNLNDCGVVSYGFGYNASNVDYKVVIVPWVNHGGGHFGTKVEVYSVRADSWRIIRDFKGGVPFHNGAYANGKIWWTAINPSASPGNRKIVSLDMATDKYEEVQGPVLEANAYNRVVTVLDERLYVLYYYIRKKVDLWVMNKFGVEESWSKVVSLPYNDVHDPAKPIGMIQVLCISRNGEIVFVDRVRSLFVYISKHKESRKIQLGGLNTFCDVFAYVESLVSPDDL